MMKNAKKLLAMIMSLAIVFCSTAPTAYAVTAEDIYQNRQQSEYAHHTKESVTEMLREAGFTDTEIEDLFIRFPYDENLPIYELVDSDNAGVMPADAAHPDYYKTYTITTLMFTQIGVVVNAARIGWGTSKANWTKVIINERGWQLAILATQIASVMVQSYHTSGTASFQVMFRWTYGDNSMEWRYLPVSFKLL